MTCREARAVILEVVRRTAGDAERLRLDEHLAICASCRAERGRWALLERLRDGPRPRVSTAGRARILDLATARRVAPEASPRSRAVRLPAFFALAAAAVAILLVVAARRGVVEPSARLDAVAAPAGLAAEREVVAAAPGVIALDGARVRYPAGTRLRAHERRVDLLAGRVDVDVTPGGRRRFRVFTPHFIVEVVGTEFFVWLDGVRTVHGVVRVLDLGERELAIVRAGESWRLHADEAPLPDPIAPKPLLPPSPTAVASARAPAGSLRGPGASPRPVGRGSRDSSPAPRTATPAARALASVPDDDGPEAVRASNPPSASPSGLDPGAATPPRAPDRSTAVPTARALLASARTALAEGDTVRARAAIRGALAGQSGPRERAIADLLLANALLIEGNYDLTVAAYRDVAQRHAGQPEAETARFAIAQFLSEQHRTVEARAALEDYLRRYPEGRFAAEVREKLARTDAKEDSR